MRRTAFPITSNPVARPVLAVFALVATFGVGTAHAQIYVGQGESGAVILSDAPGDATPDLLIGLTPKADAPAQVPVPAPALPPPAAPAVPAARPAAPAVPAALRPLIVAAARAHDLPAALVAAVAAAESGFDARARSPKGAAGLMQLLPATARRFDVHDRYSPAQSLRGGSAYLRWLHARFDGDLVRVLAAYNAGERAVDGAGGVPPFDETRAYVPRVLAFLEAYSASFGR